MFPVRISGLWRNADFLKLWAAHTTAQFGALMGALGLIAVLMLEARPAQMAVLTGMGTAPALAFGLVAGAWVDRLRRRPVLVAADIGRALSLGSVPMAHFLGTLHIEQLYAVAFLNGMLMIFFDVAHPSYVPSVVGRDNLVEANSKITAADAIVESTAFSISGWVAQLVSAIVAAVVNSCTFVASALLLLAIRGSEPGPAASTGPRRSLRAEVIEGVRYVWGDRLLRPIVISKALLGLAIGMVGSIITLFALTEVGFEPGPLGVIYGVGGISSFVGAVFASRVLKRLGLGLAIGAGMLIAGCLGFLIPAATGPLLIATVFFVVPQVFGDGLWTVHNIGEISLRQAITPDRARGRVNSAMTVAGLVAQLLGALVTGVIAETAGMRWALAVGFAAQVSAGAVLLLSPIRRVRDTPASTAR
jgi:MFS family permease